MAAAVDAACQVHRQATAAGGGKSLSGNDSGPERALGMSVAACPAVQNHLPFAHVQADAFDGAIAAVQPAETRMILIVGANVRLMEWAALSLFRAGHIPVLGQWFWPLVSSEAAATGADVDDYGDPVAERLIGRCDAVLRVDGHAPEADALVTSARARGLRVYLSLDDALAG